MEGNLNVSYNMQFKDVFWYEVTWSQLLLFNDFKLLKILTF